MAKRGQTRRTSLISTRQPTNEKLLLDSLHHRAGILVAILLRCSFGYLFVLIGHLTFYACLLQIENPDLFIQ